MKTRAQELGEAIEKDRTRAGASQEDVAKAVGVTQQALSGWEAGVSLPRSARLERLRVFFGPGSDTDTVVAYIISAPEQDHREYTETTGGEHITRSKVPMRNIRGQLHAPNIGLMTSEPKQSGPPMSNEEPTAHAEQNQVGYGIKSFEERSIPSIEMRDALTRAAKGVQLARQVLDDAADQLDRALSKLKA